MQLDDVQRQNSIITSLVAGKTTAQAAAGVGVSRQTVAAYCKAHPEFGERAAVARRRAKTLAHEVDVITAEPVGTPRPERRVGLPAHGDLGGDALRPQPMTPPLTGDPAMVESLELVVERDGMAAGLPSFSAVAALLWATATDPDSRAQGRCIETLSKLVCVPVMAIRATADPNTPDEAVRALLELARRGDAIAAASEEPAATD